MKKTITSLSLLACILIPITQAQAESNYRGLTQDQVEGGDFDPNTANGLNNLINFNKNNNLNTTKTEIDDPKTGAYSKTTVETMTQYIKNIAVAVENGAYGAITNSIIDVTIATLKKVNPHSTFDSAKVRKYISESALSEETFTKASSKMAGNALKSFVMDLIINGISDYTASVLPPQNDNYTRIAVRESTWLLLKNAEVYATSGGNPASILAGEAGILVEVVSKNIEGIGEALDAKGELGTSEFNGKVINMKLQALSAYAKGENNLIETREKMKVLLKDEGIKQNNPLYGKMLNDIDQSYLRVAENKNNHLNELINSGDRSEFEAYLSGFYPKEVQTDYRAQFDTKHPPVSAIIVTIDDDPVVLIGKEEDSEEVESHTWVNPNIKPSQAELDANAKEQLLITSKLNSSNRSLNALNSHLQNTKEELRKLEAQERMNNGGNSDSMNQQQNQVSAEEVTGAERKFKLYFQAYLLSKKYNGDIDKISKEGGKDLVKLKILANNLLGAGREWRTLFTNGKSLLDDQHQKVFALQKAYRNATPQQDTGSSKSTKRLATLRKEIEQLEQTIIPKRRENTDYQLQKNDIDFITMNLTDAANDDNKVILAVNQISDSDSSSDSHWWTGNYTRVYYQDRSGVLYFGGYGDAEAETEEIKPGNGSILYLHQSDDSDSVDERTRTLSESEASYFGNYSYTAWGTWSDTNATRKIYTSHWVVTDYTPDIDMPRQGHATYEGELAGGQWTIGQTGYNSVNGNITLNADFGTNTISGNINVKNASTGSTWGTASISNGTITNTELDGQLVGAGISTTEDWHSQISGSFGGPQASEAGGMWAITKGTGANGDERAVGVFRAKKQ